ncbi:MAG: protein kinase, partial [Verrucomicrobiae bacterium]|nr:protein kinase [Verrucomicrobiae bacterium]
VAIHEVGEQAGSHFFSMEYVEGPNLHDLTRQKPLSPKQAADQVQAVAEAIQYAHEQGVLHRDLKPSNVLITASGRPKITDFGLAKVLTSDTDLTLSGQVLGTPHYLPPEQASGKRGRVGPWSDVYGLGAILYHLLTGRPPFQAEALTEVLDQVAHREPVSPRLLNPSVPRDLETICLKCLEKEPGRRYGSAGAVAEDLGRYARSETIVARPASPPEKAWRWCRRKPALAGALAACTLALATGVLGISWQWRRAEGEATRANQGELEARRNLYAADMMLGVTALDEHDYGRVRSLLAHHLPDPTLRSAASGEAKTSKAGEDLRGWEWRYLAREARSDALCILGRHSNAVARVVSSPDGRYLASGNFDRTVKIWDLATREELGTLTHPGRVTGLAFSPDSNRLATGSRSEAGELRLWNVGDWEESLVISSNLSISDVDFAPDSQFLVTGSATGIRVWDLAKRVQVASLARTFFHDQPWCHAAFVGGDEVVFTQPSGSLWFWAWRGANEPVQQPNLHGNILALKVLPADGVVLTAGEDKSCRVWDLAAQAERAAITGNPRWTYDLDLSPDGTLLATGGADQRVTLWDTTSWKPVRFLRGHEDPVWALEFIPPAGRHLATGSVDGTVRLWNVQSGEEHAESDDWDDGWHWPTRDADGRIEWNRAPLPAQPFANYQAYSSPIATLWPVGMSTQGMIAATIVTTSLAAPRRSILVWHLSTGVLRHIFQIETGTVQHLAFSAEGTLLAAMVGPDCTVQVWEVETAEQRHRFATRRAATTALAVSGRGLTVAVGSQDGSIELWSMNDGRRVGEIATHANQVLALAFSPDGDLLASAGREGRIRLCRLGGDSIATQVFEVRVPNPISVAISTDARTLAVGDTDGMIHLFSAKTGLPVGRIAAHREMTMVTGATAPGKVAVGFLADGNRLVSAGVPWAPVQLFQLKTWRATTSTEPTLQDP